AVDRASVLTPQLWTILSPSKVARTVLVFPMSIQSSTRSIFAHPDKDQIQTAMGYARRALQPQQSGPATSHPARTWAPLRHRSVPPPPRPPPPPPPPPLPPPPPPPRRRAPLPARPRPPLAPPPGPPPLRPAAVTR